MIVVIFELWPRPGAQQRYFDTAARLADSLKQVDGFVSVERFESKSEPGKFLSLSFWRDEESVKQWRTQTMHRNAQKSGRDTVFADYRLRVSQVIRDYGMQERKEAPADSNHVLGAAT
ncbi:MAG TPA: antibiotic biosynthesis monooxygenase [Burkholderiaceae bacterium]|nr:antibiotic biosynthesis monooxygenase [Burkholderiaceae bacterium]